MSPHDAMDRVLKMLFSDDADNRFGPGDLEALAELVEARRVEELGLRVIEALLLKGSANVKARRLLERARDSDL
jgi:hypothetical protein